MKVNNLEINAIVQIDGPDDCAAAVEVHQRKNHIFDDLVICFCWK
jgi:hypothetical protein